MTIQSIMFLIDTNIISELRKSHKADTGVVEFFANAIKNKTPLYISAITLGELRRGIELIINRGDVAQGKLLADWLDSVQREYQHNVLTIDAEIALLWGKMRGSNPHNAIDKLIAATALMFELTVVTRNIKDFENTGVNLLNPFSND
ncbi:MAG: type II toxin-antitoxin system VapC family toxin [Methylomonas sp.]